MNDYKKQLILFIHQHRKSKQPRNEERNGVYCWAGVVQRCAPHAGQGRQVDGLLLPCVVFRPVWTYVTFQFVSCRMWGSHMGVWGSDVGVSEIIGWVRVSEYGTRVKVKVREWKWDRASAKGFVFLTVFLFLTLHVENVVILINNQQFSFVCLCRILITEYGHEILT